jgi:hypothetical protein
VHPYFVFSDENGVLRDGLVHFDKSRRSNYIPGMPIEPELRAGRGLGYRYCNLMWVTGGYTIICIDYLDLYQLLR